jgi:hypothetical protein
VETAYHPHSPLTSWLLPVVERVEMVAMVLVVAVQVVIALLLALAVAEHLLSQLSQ